MLLILFSISFGQLDRNRSGITNSSIMLTGEDYITGEDGVPRMSINIWGHVKYPGTYLVYDGIDILTCISMAGGPIKGAKISKVTILSEDGSSRIVDLDKLLHKDKINTTTLKPRDTIHIDETLGNFIFSRSNIIPILLQTTILIVNLIK